MFNNGNNVKGAVANLKIKPVALIYPCLPNIARLIIFLGAQGRMQKITH